jgi:hypothetical protein
MIESGDVFMNPVESAPFAIGKNKFYRGVVGNWWLMPANFSFNGDLKALLPLTQRQSHIMKQITKWLFSLPESSL